jgi:hypothetical protein
LYCKSSPRNSATILSDNGWARSTPRISAPIVADSGVVRISPEVGDSEVGAAEVAASEMRVTVVSFNDSERVELSS